MNAVFGPLRRHDRQRFRDLLRYCFILTDDQVRNWLDDETPDDWLIAGYAGDDLLTGAIVQPMTVMGAMQASVGAIGGVATAPHARGQGLARGLMAYALRRLREQSIPWAILHPFDFAFYHRLGWGQGAPMVRVSLKQPGILGRTALPGTYRLVGVEAREDLDLIHRAGVLNGPGALVRGERQWSRLLLRPAAPRLCAVWENGGEAGYVVYELRRSAGASRLDGVCTVHDWAWTAPTAREALLFYLANHAGQVGRIDMKVSVDDPLTNLEGEGVERVFIRGPMVRITDVATWRDCREPLSSDARAPIRLHDRLCPWNEATHWLGPSNAVAPMAPRPLLDPPVAEIGIAAFSSLMWGSLSLDTALHCGMIQNADSPTMDALASLIPRSPPFFLDWF